VTPAVLARVWRAFERIIYAVVRDRRTERPVPEYIQQLWDGQVALQNSFDQLQQRTVDDLVATQEQINQLTERVQGLQASLTHAEGEIRTELDRLANQGVDTSGLENAVDSLAQQVQATEDVIPDADTGGGSTPSGGGGTPSEPAPPEQAPSEGESSGQPPADQTPAQPSDQLPTDVPTSPEQLPSDEQPTTGTPDQPPPGS
jgi:hypothetical protein